MKLCVYDVPDIKLKGCIVLKFQSRCLIVHTPLGYQIHPQEYLYLGVGWEITPKNIAYFMKANEIVVVRISDTFILR